MCKVVIEQPKEKAGFIICNHLYSRQSEIFTTPVLLDELRQYGLDISEEELQDEINTLIDDGAVSQRVGYYKRMAML